MVKTVTSSAGEAKPGPLIFISAAEPSADLHGANLIRAVRAISPHARFVGVAGPRMVDAGCERIFDMTRHSAMLLGALRVVGQGIRMIQTAEAHLRKYPFDTAVVIDSPTLHLPLAARAHAAGIPVLYYIAPQLWAWGAYRIHKLRNNVDRAAAILPFEERYFRDQGVEATFVGHPLAEHCGEHAIDDAVVEELRADANPFIAILPGSRSHVVASNLPGQIQVAAKIAQVIPKAKFGISVANQSVADAFNECPGVEPIVGCTVGVGSQAGAVRWLGRTHGDHHPELIRAADLVLVTSGTSTLEVAFHGRPMIVMYQASRLFYQLIGRWMISTPYLSLPNILAGREIVPEFMPYYGSTEVIAQRAIELLRSEDQRSAMQNELAGITEPLRHANASKRTAGILMEMIAASRH